MNTKYAERDVAVPGCESRSFLKRKTRMSGVDTWKSSDLRKGAADSVKA